MRIDYLADFGAAGFNGGRLSTYGDYFTGSRYFQSNVNRRRLAHSQWYPGFHVFRETGVLHRKLVLPGGKIWNKVVARRVGGGVTGVVRA